MTTDIGLIMKTIFDYREKVEEWGRRLELYTTRNIMHNHMLTFSFINQRFEELFMPQIEAEVCLFLKDELKPWFVHPHFECEILGPKHHVYYKTQRRRWMKKTIEEIEDWFAVYYPGVDPWIDRLP